MDIMPNEFRSQASEGKIRAAGICFGVRIVPPAQVDKADAIQVALEREDGDAVDIFVPYEQLLDGEFTYGELFACERIPKLFVLQHQQDLTNRTTKRIHDSHRWSGHALRDRRQCQRM